MTKVCFVSSHAYPLFDTSYQGSFGGAEIQLSFLAKELAKDSTYDVHILVADVDQPRVQTFHGVTVWRGFRLGRRLKWLCGIWAFFSFAVLLKRIDADIYISRAVGMETGVIALWCRLFRRRFIYMVASTIECDDRLRERGMLLSAVHRYGMKHAHQVIVQSTEQRNMLRRHVGLSGVLLRNSFSFEKAGQIPIGKRGLLWVSSSQPLKQPEIFLSLARRFETEDCVLILSPHAHHRALFDRIARAARELPNLRFLPGVPFYEVDHYYQRAKILINTSMYEGFPNTFVQAGKYGTPVVSLSVNPDRLLTSHGCGRYAEGEIENLYASVQELLDDAEAWQTASKNIRAYVEEYHDIRKNVNILKRCIMETLGKRKIFE